MDVRGIRFLNGLEVKEMTYKDDIREDALGFIEEHEKEIKESIGNEANFYDLDDLMDSLREHEFYYSLEDAVIVLRECDNMEEDSGIWDGLNPEDALVAKAMYSAENDLMAKVKEMYEEIVSEYENLSGDGDIESDKVDKAFAIWHDGQEEEVIPVKPNTPEEKELIENWLRANDKAGMWSGYPLGGSYIDSRCGCLYNEPEISEYVLLDRKSAKQLPHLSGKYRRDVEAYFKALEAK